MKKLIKKILREEEEMKFLNPQSNSIIKKSWYDLDKKHRVEHIKNNINRNISLLPKIKKLVELKFPGIRIDFSKTSVNYGAEDLVISVPVIKIYVEDSTSEATLVKREIWDSLNNYLGIDLSRYGTGLELEVYRKDWVKI